MKHTPGPWTVHHGVHDGRNSVRVCDGAHGTARGCHAIAEAEFIGTPRLVAEANARLIAAAPDLLAALTMSVSRMQALLNRGDLDGPDEQVTKKLLELARAAIAKAERGDA